MPLAFNSTSHGVVAFGFFNIDTDMLLLEQHFYFADDFCRSIVEIAKAGRDGSENILLPGYCIEDQNAIGDLMGAIHGIRYTGFIGEVYRLFPFPEDPRDFRQKPDGHRHRAEIESIIVRYAQTISVPLKILNHNDIQIGPYQFDPKTLHQLIQYVWRGGYPRWRENRRPAYVRMMSQALEKQSKGLFKSLSFQDS
jgi:hypothetical protein